MSGLPHILCVGAIVHDPHGRLLMVLRANAPARGTWSIPGGRLLPGELPEAGCAREVREETGLDVEVGELVGRVDRPAPAGGTYLSTTSAARSWPAPRSPPTPATTRPTVAG